LDARQRPPAFDLATARAHERAAPLDDLAALRFGVRVDRPGTLRRDFQTAQGVIAADQSKVHPTTLSQRYYLSDAAFLVGLAGDAEDLVVVARHYAS